MSNVDPRILASRLKPEVGGIPVEFNQLRVGQIARVEMENSPPQVRVGPMTDNIGAIPMRIMGNPWDYTPGDTVLWADMPGLKIVLGKLPMVGSELDPLSEEFTPWREVGAAGEPAFENGWGNFGAPHETAGFWKQSDGWVRLKGLVGGGTATAGTTIFELPFGYNPDNARTHVTISNTAAAVIQILASGEVRCHLNCNTAWVSLAGITFPSNPFPDLPTGSTVLGSNVHNRSHQWQPHLTPGWHLGTTVEEHLYFHVRDDGWVWVEGTLDAVTVPGNALIIPERASAGYDSKILHGVGAGIARHDVGGNLLNRGPRNWRVETGGTGQHYLGGLNYWGYSCGRLVADLPHSGDFVNLINGWTNFGQDFQAPRYWKDHHGIVHVVGLTQGSASTSDTIGNLPAGFRPGATHVFNGMWNNLQGRTDVEADGDIVAVGHPNNTWHNLSGITFRAMQ